MRDRGRRLIAIALTVFSAFISFQALGCAEDGNREPPPDRGAVTNYLDITPQFPKNYTLAEGQPAPEFSYATIDNKVIYLTDYIGQKYVILNFFETDSPFCKRQCDVLQEYYAQNRDIVEIIGITSQDVGARDLIHNLISEYNIEYPIIHDPSKRISEVYQHRYEPFFAFIDKNGVVIEGYTGSIFEIAKAVISLFNWTGPDEIESNDTRADADWIKGKLIIEGYAHPGDHDWYRLGGQEGTGSSFMLTYNDDECNIDMEIFSGHALVGVLNDPSSPNKATCQLPETCYLHVYIHPGQIGSYTIELEPQE